MRKRYFFLITEDRAQKMKQFSLSEGFIRAFLFSLASLLILFVLFLSYSLKLNFDDLKFNHLEKENQNLKKELVSLNRKLSHLENKVSQVDLLSNKIKKIVSIRSDSPEKKAVGGRLGMDPNLNILKTQVDRSPASKAPAQEIPSLEESSPSSLNLRLESLKKKTNLVKIDAWTLFTELSQKKEIADSTPSILPVKGGWLSSNYGYRNESIYSDHDPSFHRGTDFAANHGSPVVSTAKGKVIYTGYDEHGYGNMVVIDHGYGLKSYYAHLAEIKTSSGKKVERGDIIASVGNTGRSTGPHLHYEIRIFGNPVNPEHYILDRSELFTF